MTRAIPQTVSRRSSRAPTGAGLLRAALVAGALLVRAAAAGDHHAGESLRCSDCHVMHFSQAHGYEPSGVGFYAPLLQGPERGLLRDRVNDLCLSCHDGAVQATDVFGAANTGSQPGIVRAAGYLDRVGFGAGDSGHTLDSLAEAPGSQPTWRPEDENGPGRGLACTNCHAPHGEAGTSHPTGSQYRNLRVDPGNGASLFVTTNATPGALDLGRDVFVRQARAYDESVVDWCEPDANDSAIARWCGGCHSFAHDADLVGGGGGGAWGGFLDEHPVWAEDLGGEGLLAHFATHTNRVKVMSELGLWDPPGSDVTPTCVTCHRAHGNGNPDGLIYRSGTGTPTEDGDTGGGTLDDLCSQCHVEGSSFGG